MKRLNRRGLNFESLEARELMATNVTASLSGGVLSIIGTEKADAIYVLQSDGASREVQVGSSRGTKDFGAFRKVDRIEIVGLGGSDVIDLQGKIDAHQVKVPATIWGDYKDKERSTDAKDTITGGQVVDKIYGGGGKDVISGSSGGDYLYGGGDDDVIQGASGSDFLYGGAGHDQLSGGNQDDNIYGEAGNDELYGGSGNDSLNGGANNDRLYGGDGTDSLQGGDGDDWLEAGTAKESAKGGGGTNWNAHRWAIDGTSQTDIEQQSSNRCVILAALSGAAKLGVNLAGRISYLGDFTYRVQMFDAAASKWVNIEVPFAGRLITNDAGAVVDPAAAYESTSQVSEFWTVLFQRAYAKQFLNINPLFGNDPAYQQGESDHAQALAAVTGWTTESPGHWDIEVTTKRVTGPLGIQYTVPVITQNDTVLASRLKSAVDHGDLVTIGGSGHAYHVVSVAKDAKGVWKATLYNPWHLDAVHDPWGKGDDHGPFSFEKGKVDGDGYIEVSVETIRTNFAHYFRAIKP
jgi:hypothetical protein